jgi:hypothetical protein
MRHENHENTDPEIKAFEAALASLRPRADRLDERRREVLAEMDLPSPDQPSVGARRGAGNAILPSPFGRGAGGEGCVDPSGHQFLCIHCGIAFQKRRWAWPAAFSAMSAIAAVLLVMLTVRSSTPIAERTDKPRSEYAPTSDDRLAEDNAMPILRVHPSDEMPYLALRNQILRDGVDSWKQPVSTVATAVGPPETPLSYREQLNRLLQQEGYRGS